MRTRLALLAAAALLAAGCTHVQRVRLFSPDIPLTAAEIQLCEELRLDPGLLSDLKGRPLFTFTPQEVDQYLRYARATVPDLRERTVHLGRKNIGQPYEIYLLGEFPYEIHDPQPLFCLDRSDCVVFSEHTYAMALAHDWPSFFRTLLRLRYRDGQIGYMTRNHWTERDWVTNNSWLIEDINREIGGGDAWRTYEQQLRRNVFFMRRAGLGADLATEELTFDYIPVENLERVLPDLQAGDFVNVIRGTEEAGWAGHTGLIAIADDGTVNFLDSSSPAVREQPLMRYAHRATHPPGPRLRQRLRALFKEPTPRPATIGFRFFRLRAEELEREYAVTPAQLVRPVPDPGFGRSRVDPSNMGWVGAGRSASPEAAR